MCGDESVPDFGIAMSSEFVVQAVAWSEEFFRRSERASVDGAQVLIWKGLERNRVCR